MSATSSNSGYSHQSSKISSYSCPESSESWLSSSSNSSTMTTPEVTTSSPSFSLSTNFNFTPCPSSDFDISAIGSNSAETSAVSSDFDASRDVLSTLLNDTDSWLSPLPYSSNMTPEVTTCSPPCSLNTYCNLTPCHNFDTSAVNSNSTDTSAISSIFETSPDLLSILLRRYISNTLTVGESILASQTEITQSHEHEKG